MIVYLNGEYLEHDRAKIDLHDRGFQFSDGVYEVVRTYNGKLFYLGEHLDRLRRSLNEIKIFNVDIEAFNKIISGLIWKNELSGKEFSIYIQVTRGILFPRRHSFSPPGTMPTIYAAAALLNIDRKQSQTGVKVIFDDDIRWLRCDIKTIGLLPNILAQQKAADAGAVEAVFVRENKITEGTHTNFFGVAGGKLFTAPSSNLILNGITRRIIINVARGLNIPIVEEYIDKNSLDNYNEFFITGTTTEIKPVIQLEDKIAGDGRPGEITRRIQKAFYKMADTF